MLNRTHDGIRGECTLSDNNRTHLAILADVQHGKGVSKNLVK